MKIYKAIIFLTLLLPLFYAQAGEPIPQWAINEPATLPSANYVYISGMGIGYNETDAINKAWDDALKKSMLRGGLLEYSNEGVDILRNRIARKPKCQTPAIFIGNGQVKVYVLFQIPKKAGDVVDDSEENLDCWDEKFERDLKVWNYGEYPFSERLSRSFVPGMAQIYKGSTGKGVAFIVGEVVLIGGIVTFEGLRASYKSKINTTHNASTRQKYINNTNTMQNLRNGFIAGAAALYIWNVIDGIVAKGKKHVSTGYADLQIVPYISPYATGFTLNMNLKNKKR